jgi:hypothetical protein
MKKLNYKDLAESYEEVMDVKNRIIGDYEVEVKLLTNILLDDDREVIKLRKDAINLRVDRITLVIIIIMLLVALAIKF